MFRKKKNLGSVTVFEDDDAADAPAADQFHDLGLSPPPAEDLDGLTAQQLEALALGSAQVGKESTARALRLATEAREVGVNTAQKMHAQTAQLEKMSDDIEVVHDYLDKSERIIDKMSRPKLARLFVRKKAGGKGLDKVKTSRKDADAREELRRGGVDAVDLKGMRAAGEGDGPAAVTLDDLERDVLLEGAELVEASAPRRARIGRRKKDAAPPAARDAREVQEDYSQYSEGVAHVMRKQDDDLDQISGALADMQALAGAMNNELDYQDKLINEVQDFTVETSVRTKENARKINKIK